MAKWWKNSTESSAKLTPKSISDAFDYLYSDEYDKVVKERVEAETKGMMIVSKAFKEGKITELEMMRLALSIKINGGLFVSKKTKERLEG